MASEVPGFAVTVNDASETVVIEPPKEKPAKGGTANVDQAQSDSSKG